ncbi:MAG TPA: FkbM family methyltransferase [Terriglobales bacterium]|nr:FkbM family methyltransferase [Terriglobales bacterium]
MKWNLFYHCWPLAKILLTARRGMSLSKFSALHIKRGQQVIDIGAHAGVTASVFSCCVGPKGRVDAFEPNPALRESLELARARNRWKNIFLHYEAISDSEGELEFFKDDRSIATASTFNPNHVRREMQVHGAQFSSIKVTTTTLDKFCERQNTGPHFMKIDVEGAEDTVIQGGLATIRKHLPIIWFECWCGQEQGKPVNNRLSHIETLPTLGYKLHVATVIEKGGHFVSQSDAANIQDLVPLGSEILTGPPIGIDVVAIPPHKSL